MENETEVIEITPKNMYVPICVTQAICVAVILLSVIIVKFFFNESFLKIQDWCKTHVFEQTKITANFSEEQIGEL